MTAISTARHQRLIVRNNGRLPGQVLTGLLRRAFSDDKADPHSRKRPVKLGARAPPHVKGDRNLNHL